MFFGNSRIDFCSPEFFNDSASTGFSILGIDTVFPFPAKRGSGSGFVEGMTDFKVLGAGVFTSGICDIEVFLLSGKIDFPSKGFSGETGFGGSVSRRIPMEFLWIH